MAFQNLNSKRRVCLRLLAGLAVGSTCIFLFNLSQRDTLAAADTAAAQPVLVELFTSDGCPSCPAADDLIAKLDATQFVPGAQAIVLSEHVTYFDHDGWRDPYSSEAMTKRQQKYGANLGLESSYTPQVIVDGAAQVVGSDLEGLKKAIVQAATLPKPEIQIEDLGSTEDEINFAAYAPAGMNGTLMAALAEDVDEPIIAKGENVSRTVHHVAVVLVLNDMGPDVADGRPLTLKLPSAIADGRQSEKLRLVVFLADQSNGRVLGVAERLISH